MKTQQLTQTQEEIAYAICDILKNNKVEDCLVAMISVTAATIVRDSHSGSLAFNWAFIHAEALLQLVQAGWEQSQLQEAKRWEQ